MKINTASTSIFVALLRAANGANGLDFRSEYVVMEGHGTFYVFLCIFNQSVILVDLSDNRLLCLHTDVHESYHSPLPHTYLSDDDIPDEFTWQNVNGKCYLTHSLNQHIPQYCGSCWAHAALSSLADRIKIARDAQGDDINLSIQYVLNCGADVAGSCHGGSHTGAYQFIKDKGSIPYDT